VAAWVGRSGVGRGRLVGAGLFYFFSGWAGCCLLGFLGVRLLLVFGLVFWVCGRF